MFFLSVSVFLVCSHSTENRSSTLMLQKSELLSFKDFEVWKNMVKSGTAVHEIPHPN